MRIKEFLCSSLQHLLINLFDSISTYISAEDNLCWIQEGGQNAKDLERDSLFLNSWWVQNFFFFVLNIFSVLVNGWSGGHQLKVKQRGPVPSSEDETVNSKERGFFKNNLDESSKAEMTSDEQHGQNILKKENNGGLRKRSVEHDRKTKRDVKRKPGIDQVGAKKDWKQTQRKNAKTKGKLQNGYRQNKKSKSSKKHKKEKAQVKVKGIVSQYFSLLIKSHILDSNGLW